MRRVTSRAQQVIRLARNPFDQLLSALLDARRGDCAMLVLLTGYAATWTLYGTVARSSQDLHPDMAELISWSRDLDFGYLKHPPLAAWLVRLWFTVFPLTDWSYYLLAMLMPTIALWIVWLLSADYLEIEKRVVGVALLMLIPFYNFQALKFNANTVLLPTWAGTTFWFLRSYKTHNPLYSALAGIGAGACMLGKYWSVFLLAGLILAALIDPRRWNYLRSTAPWITVVAGFAVLGPHLFWLSQHNFVPFEYAIARHGGRSFADVAVKIFAYLAGCAAYAAVPIVFVLVAARPDRATIAEMIWPPERRLVAVTFWGPLLLPIGVALASGTGLTPLWSLPAWTLLPVLLLSPPAVKVWPINVRRTLAVAVAEPVVMLMAAPAIAVAIHWLGVAPPAAHGRLLAAATERAWREVTPEPLRFVGCDVADEVIAYAKDRPRSLPLRFFRGDIADKMYADARGWPQSPTDEPESIDAQLTKTGMALVCSAEKPDWMQAAVKQAARDPKSLRIETTVARNFLGIRGQPQTYVIFIIPPHP
jgi:4-amino-4-deoxy-L-arabinose transferase-like glycosyltransferase